MTCTTNRLKVSTISKNPSPHTKFTLRFPPRVETSVDRESLENRWRIVGESLENLHGLVRGIQATPLGP